jgi:hypothetical protein
LLSQNTHQKPKEQHFFPGINRPEKKTPFHHNPENRYPAIGLFSNMIFRATSPHAAGKCNIFNPPEALAFEKSFLPGK